MSGTNLFLSLLPYWCVVGHMTLDNFSWTDPLRVTLSLEIKVLNAFKFKALVLNASQTLQCFTLSTLCKHKMGSVGFGSLTCTQVFMVDTLSRF